MNFKQEIIERKDGRAEIITIQTNEQNSLTRTTLLELQNILEEIKAKAEIKAVIITSENEKFFSNGVDAQNIINTPPERLAEEMGEIVLFFNYLMRFEKPLIAEVGGYAMGGGAVITMGSDYKYMLAGKGRISFTEVFFGLPLAGTFMEKLKISVLPNRINDVSYGGIFKAQEAAEIGLIDEIANTREDLRKIVLKKLDQVLKIPSSAFSNTKISLHRHIIQSTEFHMKTLAESFSSPVIMANLNEAMSALQEKRRPQFK